MLDLVMCGGARAVVAADAAPRRYRHAEHVLGLHIAGAGSCRLGDEVVAVGGPYLALLPAGELDENGMSGAIDSRWCLFRSRLVAGDGGQAGLLWPGAAVRRPHARRLAPAEVRLARERMVRMAALHARPAVADRLAAAALLLELLALWASPAPGAGGADAVEAFRARIEERADDPACSLAALARAGGRHPDGLSRRFTAAYGLSPVEYRIRLRLTRARELLQTSALRVAEAARVVGFANPAHFSRLFRRHFGCRPSDLARLDG
ncbi:MAG: AraC family transcriptional regulator [Planctomycetes bacterium]|nr:AraC family transcriptional regulator [Planctomycetota bacterium]